MKKKEEIIMSYLATQRRPCSTASIGSDLNITIYQARYHLLKLCMAGRAIEIKNGRGVTSLWMSSAANEPLGH